MSVAKQLAEHAAVRRVAEAADKHKLTAALVLAIIATLVLTGISLSMYYVNGFYRYDLSRPAYEKERGELAKPESRKVYDTTSPVDAKAVNDFLKEFDGRTKDLNAYGSFRDSSLSDEDLQITAPPPAQ
ncbi:MAG TPA: hypothetical protein VLA88_01545 [Candidatus Saccharimonadales bacterium]|nr:hypothetical protein [Candidatus Saccharimonadales bacterium]